MQHQRFAAVRGDREELMSRCVNDTRRAQLIPLTRMGKYGINGGPSQSFTEGPPAILTFRISWLLADCGLKEATEKAIQRPSGENVKLCAPSVPSKGRAVSLSRSRMKILRTLPPRPTNARVLPSGDQARAVPDPPGRTSRALPVPTSSEGATSRIARVT